jgi:hypothetical protein
MTLSHQVGREIALARPGTAQPLWTFRYGGTPKPHFSSLRTPAGHELALVEPVDHLWHRGLWFTVKFVNGVNFWEERDEFGRQEVAGVPGVVATKDSVTLDIHIDWVGPGGDVPIREWRLITWHPGQGHYRLNWTSIITAQTDLELDRTPFTTWGGYGGLSFRGNRLWHLERYLLPTGPDSPLTPGVRAPWADLSGSFDGGASLTGGLTLIERRAPRAEPTPWYGGGNPSMNFVNAAFLFDGPQHLAANASREFHYQVIVHDGIWTEDTVEKLLTAREGTSGT